MLAVTLARIPYSPQIFRTMSEAFDCLYERCLRVRMRRWVLSYARTTIATPPAWKSGSTVTISPLKSDWVVDSPMEPSLTSSSLPISSLDSSSDSNGGPPSWLGG